MINTEQDLQIRLFQENDRAEIEKISWQVQEWEKQYYPGRALSVEKIAKEKYGLSKMLIAVICGNEGAEKLYKRMGYIPYELELVKNI